MKKRYFVKSDDGQLKGEFYKKSDKYIVDFSGNISNGGYAFPFVFVTKQDAENKLKWVLDKYEGKVKEVLK